jgi:hypothetical protein
MVKYRQFKLMLNCLKEIGKMVYLMENALNLIKLAQDLTNIIKMD